MTSARIGPGSPPIGVRDSGEPRLRRPCWGMEESWRMEEWRMEE